MVSDGAYYLYSKLPGEPSLGIAQQELVGKQAELLGQPVGLTANLVEWIARPKIIGGGPTHLSVGPFKYTGEYNGELAFATNKEDYSRVWYLVPSEQYYLIVANPRSDLVWTVGEKDEIKIRPYTGNDNQFFTFKSIQSTS